ncbi:hypothetical protein BH11PLA2_BH11PLA2_32900 [soil metagenome]
MNRCCIVLSLAIVILATSRPIQADYHYTWNDEFTGSTFGGQFTVNPSLLQPMGGAGRLLTFNAIVSSDFYFSRGSFFNPVHFKIEAVSGGIVIDPLTSAVLSGGTLYFGASNVITIGSPAFNYQVLSGRVDFNSLAAVPNAGAEKAYLLDTAHPEEYLASVGHWEGIAVETPAPAGWVLASMAVAMVGITRNRCRRQSQ